MATPPTVRYVVDDAAAAVTLEVQDDLNGNAGLSIAYWTDDDTGGWEAKGENGSLLCELGTGSAVAGRTLCIITAQRVKLANDGKFVVRDKVSGATRRDPKDSDTTSGAFKGAHVVVTRYLAFEE